ncbi:hypothetical protein CRENBAI_009304 [Crenichthys baileyi]|uniref:Uncharacterized protein n=1 Tax=Crenichthys baileyi TaxID=28760 RepID=A0AAV9SJ93_9TELE
MGPEEPHSLVTEGESTAVKGGEGVTYFPDRPQPRLRTWNKSGKSRAKICLWTEPKHLPPQHHSGGPVVQVGSTSGALRHSEQPLMQNTSTGGKEKGGSESTPAGPTA